MSSSIRARCREHVPSAIPTRSALGAFRDGVCFVGPAALEQVKAIPDPSLILILSDINMPGMSGLEMLPKVREARPNVPVIMITAYGDDATRKRAIELGATGLLAKPIDFGFLREEISQRLEGTV